MYKIIQSQFFNIILKIHFIHINDKIYENLLSSLAFRVLVAQYSTKVFKVLQIFLVVEIKFCATTYAFLIPWGS